MDRRQSVQHLMLDLLERFLTEVDPKPPELGAVVAQLRGQRSALRKRGIAKLWVFGSVARGEARVDSDVDLMVEFDPASKISLTGLARLKADLSAMLRAKADLAERRVLKPHVREAAERDAVSVF